MKIADNELRDLFRIESGEQLLALDRGLLELEKDPDNRPLLEEVFRQIHSLKGGVRMLLLPDMEAIAHRFESVLGAARKGELHLTSEILDPLFRALDALRKLAHEAVTGEPAAVTVPEVLAQLVLPATTPTSPEGPLPEQAAERIGTAEPGESVSDAGVRVEIVGEPAALSEQPIGSPSDDRFPSGPQPTAFLQSVSGPGPRASGTGAQTEPTEAGLPAADVGGFRIETIRVSTDKLDGLMPLVGELGVTKNRLAHRLTAIEEIIGVWENLQRTRRALQATLNEIGRKSENGWTRAVLEHHAQEQKLFAELGKSLDAVRIMTYEDGSRLESIAGNLEDGIRSIRLLPMGTLFDLFPRMVRDLARGKGKEARLLTLGEETPADKRVIEEIKDPLMHMIRNAIDHGIESPDEREAAGKPRMGSIELKAYQTSAKVVVELKDDGRGIDIEAVKSTALKTRVRTAAELEAMTPDELYALILVSGFSTSTFVSDVSGRGIGLDVVRVNVERLKGKIQIQSVPGRGSTFRLELPVTMATVRALVVAVAGHKYAIPLEYVEAIRLVSDPDIFPMQGHETIVRDSVPLSVVRLVDLLELQERFESERGPEEVPEQKAHAVACVVIASGSERVGLLVDELVDELEIVLKPLNALLRRVRNVAGSTILGTGEVCIVLAAQGLLKSAQKRSPAAPRTAEKEEVKRTRVILMAEDSLTTRTQMKRILEGAGYEVVAAVDGLDAINKIPTRPFDALVTDVMMPNMDGLTLTQKLRENPKYKELPIILVTTLSSDEDRRRGLQAGASAYITKPAFDQKVFLDTLRRLT
ncbi:MAG: hybrid sensor histidine kinase/response regulator [Thermodesulfobacteriota bacterium]